MPWDGSGNFLRVHDWTDDADAGIKIKADRHDAEDNNLAAGIGACLTKDGQTSPTADFNLGGFKLIGVGTPIDDEDGATKKYVDENGGIAVTDDAAPATAVDGRLWWDSDKGKLYIYYNDGNTSQWVEASAFLPDLTQFATKAEAGQTWFDWTPTLSFGGASVGLTYGSRSGRGVKQGKKVQLWWDLALANKGTSTGSATVGGIIHPGTGGLLQPGSIGYTTGMGAGYANLGCYFNPATNLITVTAPNSASGAGTALNTASEANFTNASRFIGQVSYEVA